MGYRKPTSGAGSWIGKVVIDGNRIEARLGAADDAGAGFGAISYRAAVSAALEWSLQQHAAIEARVDGETASGGPTVRSAVEAYVTVRKARSTREGGNAGGRLTRHVLSDEDFASTALARLRASHIEDWRKRLSESSESEEGAARAIAPATINRLMNDLRAALNAAAELHRRALPPHLPAEIKVGTRALAVTDDARKQLLDDQQIRAAIEAAFKVDPDGDFGRLVLVAAATGARHSQLRSMLVGDVQEANLRLMVPGSKKGRAARAKPRVAVPVAQEVIDKLKGVVEGRAQDEHLLERWAYRRVERIKWVKDHRRPWGPAYEIDKFWAATVAEAKLPADTIFYALRHSSVVRGLRLGLPVRLVAATHDTSSEMIERHYSAFIVDATEELSRRAALTL
ncbi:integrase [Aminobacter niigataensis]|uniref:integrase n=1 Tax=Aminobacter niigataensis TaxID=83265 RepID=UPI00298F0240|nr:integrase [Aminobacter niigataensis]